MAVFFVARSLIFCSGSHTGGPLQAAPQRAQSVGPALPAHDLLQVCGAPVGGQGGRYHCEWARPKLFQKIIFWKSMSLFPKNDLLKMTTPRISIFFILRRKLNWLPETTGCL